MRRYLKAHLGRTVVIQCWGVAFRGEIASVRRDGVELVGASLFDETQSYRSERWQPMDGRVFVPAPAMRFAQVV